MFSTYLTEIALRKAVLDLGRSEDASLEQAQASAITHATTLVKSQFDAKQQFAQINLQEVAINLAIQAIRLAWVAMNEQLARLGRARLDFDKERKSGIATFLIPTNKERRDLAYEQSAINAFLEVSQSHDQLFNYLGMKVNTIEESLAKVEGVFLSTLPYYKMSDFLAEPLGSKRPSECVRRTISLFFKTQVPKFLGEIDKDFDGDNRVADFFRSSWHRDNFLNDYRGPRIIAMALCNLLWNLQHPVDIETGFALGLDEKISLCRSAGVYINRLLDNDTPPNLSKFDSDGEFLSFIGQIETYIAELKLAYEDEKLHSLNLEEVVGHAHGTTRILDDNIFKLVYDKPNMAAELASLINYLNLRLKRDGEILSIFNRVSSTHSLVNHPAVTVMDVLLIFSQLKGSKRRQLLHELSHSGFSGRASFATTLATYSKKFLKPIYQACQKSLGSTFLDDKGEQAQQMTFERILPLVGLACSDYRVEVDTDVSLEASKRAKVLGHTFKTGQEQINTITRLAYQNSAHEHAMFSWDLSSYITLTEEVTGKINELPRRQYKLGQLTALLDALQSFISQYKSFLQYPKFKTFVIEALNDIGREFHSLRMLLSELETDINVDTTDNRRLIDTIKTMDKNLLGEIAKFTQVINSLEEKMLAPDFEENIRKEILSRLNDLHERFYDAFGHDEPGLQSFVGSLQGKAEPQAFHLGMDDAMEHKILVKPASISQVTRMASLITDCHNALSSSSKAGEKGRMLREIHTRLTRQDHITPEQLKEVAKELARIVCAYRPTFFFQAAYGHTRSANILVNEIIATLHDESFPLSTWLFGDDFQIALQLGTSTHTVIYQHLEQLKTQSYWAENADFLRETRLFA